MTNSLFYGNQKNMNTIIIYLNEEQLNNKLKDLERSRLMLQELFTEINRLNADYSLGFKIKTIEDLGTLARDGEESIKQKIAESLPSQTVGLFKLKRRATVDILDLPSFTMLNDIC